MQPYVEALQMPLLVRWPAKIAAGAVSKALVTPLDLFPSLLSLCGIDAPEGLDGKGMFGAKPAARERVEIANFSGNPEQAEDGNEWRGWYARNRLAVEWRNGEAAQWNLESDPYQLKKRRLPMKKRTAIAAGSSYRNWFTPERSILKR